jgi:hypothetical protein
MDNIENKRYFYSEEKHRNIRVGYFLIFLVDSTLNQNNVPNNFIKIFKRYLCVPIYGDMSLVVTKTIFKSCKTVIQFFPEKMNHKLLHNKKF